MNLIESEVGMTILHMYNTPPPSSPKTREIMTQRCYTLSNWFDLLEMGPGWDFRIELCI